MKKRISIVLFAIMVMLFAGGLTVYAESFNLSQTKATVNIGDTIDLDITGTDKAPRWTSWNVNTARVDQDGEVTAVRKGKTMVTARVGLTFKKCTVTVVDPTIKINKKAVTIYTGGTSAKTVQLKATPKGASKEITWSSSNPAVAIVDIKGKVTSVSAGTTTITATANGESASCVVTVKESSISLNLDSLQLGTKGNGSSIKLSPTVVGSQKSVNWTTSDKAIATVSGGKVTGKNSGTATITATANGISTTCTVTVIKDSIAINSEKEILYVGENKQLKSNADKKDIVTWSSSNEEVATVENGKITAVGVGTANVYVEKDGFTDTCEITVKETTTSIGEDTIELRTKGTDKTCTLGYEVVGRSASVRWTTSDKTIATVSEGKVTAKKVGTVTITATANGVSDSVHVVVKDYPPTIKLNQSEYVLYTKKGNTLALKATVDGPSKKATWNSSDASVATVNAKGKVTALKEGTTLVTATANGITAECLIMVRESKVNLETQNIHLEKGQNANLPADVVGKSQMVKYATTNKKVATVKKGVITAKNYGEADIKVTANGVTAICHVSVDECVHTFDEGVITTEPTCTAEGVKTFTCAKCSDTYTETVEKAEHIWEESSRTEATCVSSGVIYYICAKCPETKQEFTELGEHSFGEWIIVTEATEFTEGMEKQYCENCDAENARTIPLKGHEHTYVGVTIEPTCTEQGYTTYSCSCGDSYIENYTDALEHMWSAWEIVKDATETEEGKEKRICNRCFKEEFQVIPITGEHTHEYEAVVTEPTCEKQGYTTYTCFCGVNYYDNWTEPLGHSYTETVTEPTCTDQGYTSYECFCGSGYIDNWSEPLGHNYTKTVIEPTCIEWGYTNYTCFCGSSYIDDYIEPIEHSYTENVIAPTCTEQGYTRYLCDCGYGYESNHIPPIPHTYEAQMTEATCTGEGYITYTCVCGDDYVADYVSPLGHAWGEWSVVIAPTGEESNIERRICGRCEVEETREVHVHHYQVIETMKPTCTSAGYEVFWCLCGDRYTENYDKLGHSLSEWYDEPGDIWDCENDGYRLQSCTRCEQVINVEYVRAPGHDLVLTNRIVSEDESYASEIYDCSRCEEHEEKHMPLVTWKQVSEDRIYAAYTLYPGAVVQINFESYMDEALLEYVQYELDISEEYKSYITITEDRKMCVSEEIAQTDLEQEIFYIKISMKENPLNARIVNTVSGRYDTCIRVPFVCAGKKEIAVEEKIQTVISQIITDDMNKGEQVLAIYQWICDNVEYDNESYKAVINPNSGAVKDPDSFTSYGAIVDGLAVCSGYADAFREFMWRLKIPTGYVTSTSLNHAWNIVMLDDEWYWLDTTWADTAYVPEGLYNYDFFLKSGIREEDQICTQYPEGLACTGTKWRFMLFEEYYVHTEDDMRQMLLEQRENDISYLVFHTSAELDAFKNGLMKRYYATYKENIVYDGYYAGGDCVVNDVYYEGYRVFQIKNTDNLREFINTEAALIGTHEHAWSIWKTTTKATCTEEGEERRVCYTCYTEEFNTLPTKAHDEGEWITVKEAEVGVTGLKELQCTKCHTVLETEEIEMLVPDETVSGNEM